MSVLDVFVRYLGHGEKGTWIYIECKGKKAQGIDCGMGIPVFNIVYLGLAYSAFVCELANC